VPVSPSGTTRLGVGGGASGSRRASAARVLEYANQLLSNGYVLDTTTYPGDAQNPPGFNQYGRAMFTYYADASRRREEDPSMQIIKPDGSLSGMTRTATRTSAARRTTTTAASSRLRRGPELPLGGRDQVRSRHADQLGVYPN